MSTKIVYIYSSVIFLMMCASYSLSFTWNIHIAIWDFLAVIVSIVLFINIPKPINEIKRTIGLISVLLLNYFYNIFTSINPIGAFFLSFMVAICSALVIWSPLSVKQRLFDISSLFTTIILSISLFGWFLYLLGYPLPSEPVTDFDDGFHTYINYHFFLIQDQIFFDFLPRFGSVFLEPGQMSSICVILLLANILLKGRKIDMVIMSISIFLSFSLAGWLVLIICLLVMLFMKIRNKVLLVVSFALIIGFFAFVVEYISEDSLIGHYIVERLEYDEENGISGNNRTNDDFDYRYERFLKTDGVYFGINKQLAEGNNWTIGNAGVKRVIVQYGYVGLFLVLSLVFVLFYHYKSRDGFILFLGYFILGAIRTFWTCPYWLYILICTLPLIKTNSKLIIKKSDI